LYTRRENRLSSGVGERKWKMVFDENSSNAQGPLRWRGFPEEMVCTRIFPIDKKQGETKIVSDGEGTLQKQKIKPTDH